MLFKGLYVKPGLDLSFMVKQTQRTIIEFMDGSSTKLKQEILLHQIMFLIYFLMRQLVIRFLS